jgi:hypothetical protein
MSWSKRCDFCESDLAPGGGIPGHPYNIDGEEAFCNTGKAVPAGGREIQTRNTLLYLMRNIWAMGSREAAERRHMEKSFHAQGK